MVLGYGYRRVLRVRMTKYLPTGYPCRTLFESQYTVVMPAQVEIQPRILRGLYSRYKATKYVIDDNSIYRSVNTVPTVTSYIGAELLEQRYSMGVDHRV